MLIPKNPALTKMEVVVLKSLLYGFDPQDIANEVFISVRTIRNHINSIHTKLKYQSTAAMIAAIYQTYIKTNGIKYN